MPDEHEVAVDLASYLNIEPDAALQRLRAGAVDEVTLGRAKGDFGPTRGLVAKQLRRTNP